MSRKFLAAEKLSNVYTVTRSLLRMKEAFFIFGLLFGMCDLQYIFMETRRRPLMANALYVVISTHLTFFAMLD